MSALVAHGGTLDRYAVELTSLLQVIGASGYLDPPVDRLLGLRGENATELALPTQAP